MKQTISPGLTHRPRRGAGLILLLIALVALVGWRWNGARLLAGDGTPGAPEARTFTNSLGMQFLHFPAGQARGEDNTAHAFLFTLRPVTQKQWTELMGENPSDSKGDDLPVENVSGNDAARFCWKLSQIEGRKYALPTEEQWAWVQQAGATAPVAAMPRFTAVGWLTIGSMHRPGLSNDSAPLSLEQLAIEQKSQVMLLHSDAVLSEALRNPNSQIRKTEWFKSFKNDIAAVQEDIGANFVFHEIPGTRLLKVQFSCSNAKDAKVILDEMVDTHLERQKQLGYDELRDQMVELNDKRINLEREIHDESGQLEAMREKLNIDGSGIGRVGIMDIELQQCTTEEFALERKAAHAKGVYDLFIAQVQAGHPPAAVDRMVETNPLMVNMIGQLQAYENAIQQASMAVETNEAQVKKIESQRDQFQKKLDDKKAEVRTQAIAQITQEMHGDMGSADKDVKDMEDHLTHLKQDAGALSNAMNGYQILENQTRGLREELKHVQDLLDHNNVMAIQNMQTKIQWSSRAEIPENESFAKLWIVLDAP